MCGLNWTVSYTIFSRMLAAAAASGGGGGGAMKSKTMLLNLCHTYTK